MVVHLEMNNYGMLPQAVERIRRLFDLDADPVKIARHLSGDAALRPLVDLRPGLRIPGAWDRFEAVVLAVLGQSIASVGPKKMIARLVRLFGKPVESPVRGIGYLFPGPEVLATAELSKAGVGEASIRTLRKLAHAAISGRLEQAVSKTWMTFGIDESTANYIALRAWGEPDAFPLQSVERAEGCRPWRAYAAMHMADR